MEETSSQTGDRWRSEKIGRQGNSEAPVGSEEWAVYVANQIHSGVKDTESNVRQLKDWIQAFRSEDAHNALGYEGWEEFCNDWLGYNAEGIDVIVSAREKARQYSGEELGTHGGDRTSEEGQDSSNNLAPDERGSDYLTARIARDHPNVHERMKEGEFRSVRQAAIEAGIIEDIRTKQIRETDGPEKMESKIRHVYGDEVAGRLFGGDTDPEKGGRPEKEDTTPTEITERDEAPSKAELAGPPQTKDPNSEEYAWQKAGLLQTCAEVIRGNLEDWEEITEEARREAIHETLGYDTFPEMLDDVVGTRPARRAVQRAHPEALFNLSPALSREQFQALFEGVMMDAAPEQIGVAIGQFYPDERRSISTEAAVEKARMKERIDTE